MAVAFDAVGPSSSGQSTTVDGGVSPITWTHVMGSVSNGLLLVGVALGNAIGTDASLTFAATYGGVSMTSIGKIHSNASTVGFIEVFQLKNPTSGSASVSVAVSGSGGSAWTLEGGSMSYSGVDQTSPTTVTSATGSSGTASKAQTVPTGDMGVWFATAGNSLSAANQTSRWIKNAATDSGAGNAAGQDAAGTGGSITGQWTVAAGDFWACVAIDLKADAGGGGGPTYNLRRRGSGLYVSTSRVR